jgi:K+-sensing histidine kinase KdpD
MLAEDLGARVLNVPAQDSIRAIVATVREERATLVVMRHVPHAGLRRFRGRPRVDELLDRLDNVDIYLVETTSRRHT